MVKRRDTAKRSKASWLFLAAVVVVYVVIACIDVSLFSRSIVLFSSLIIKIIPIFILIYVLMVITHYFITPDFITAHFAESGMKRWIFVIIGGIFSTGPIYMWYPLLADLKEKGIHDGYIATFLYSRAIKIPLLPVIVFYFSVPYVVILTAVMIAMSIVQGITVNRIMRIEQ